MGTTTLVLVSILSAVEILVILASVNTHYLKTFLGYKMWVDLLYGLGVMVYMGLSGTISGVIISTFSAFFMTLTLTAAAMMIGYKKRKVLADGTVIWINYPPKWTMDTVKAKALDLKDKAIVKFSELKAKAESQLSNVQAKAA